MKKKIEKDSDNFWHRKLTLKVRNWQFSITWFRAGVDLPENLFYEKVLFFTQLSYHLMCKLLKKSYMLSNTYLSPEKLSKYILHLYSKKCYILILSMWRLNNLIHHFYFSVETWKMVVYNSTRKLTKDKNIYENVYKGTIKPGFSALFGLFHHWNGSVFRLIWHQYVL